MKKYLGMSITALFLLAGCQENNDTWEANTAESAQLQAQTSTDSQYSQTEGLLTYNYDDSRSTWLYLNEANDVVEAEGNYQTVLAMESVISNEFRQELQQYYDDGYALELETGEPTGLILARKAEAETIEISVGLSNLDYDRGKEAAEEISAAEKATAETQVITDSSENSNQKVNDFDEAVSAIKNVLDLSEDDSTYTFYDFGIQNDQRNFYYVMYRLADESAENFAKVYQDDGEVVFE
ncbi:hypothetical protein [Enterococcus sp. HY326]|uniref:hypothetical protein n=1 Tax=Enterococcus sp. HY326 TaxID=2971265 RepID=UPI00223E8F73|nr:hypothetical protein [Enterococcus sp. HY326]